jgi:hypothetical protein
MQGMRSKLAIRCRCGSGTRVSGGAIANAATFVIDAVGVVDGQSADAARPVQWRAHRERQDGEAPDRRRRREGEGRGARQGVRHRRAGGDQRGLQRALRGAHPQGRRHRGRGPGQQGLLGRRRQHEGGHP